MLTRLAKLGIASKFDLVLHLPLRYDDETHLYPIVRAPEGKPALVEGEVFDCDIKYRPRRQLVCQVRDGSASIRLQVYLPVKDTYRWPPHPTRSRPLPFRVSSANVKWTLFTRCA